MEGSQSAFVYVPRTCSPPKVIKVQACTDNVSSVRPLDRLIEKPWTKNHGRKTMDEKKNLDKTETIWLLKRANNWDWKGYSQWRTPTCTPRISIRVKCYVLVYFKHCMHIIVKNKHIWVYIIVMTWCQLLVHILSVRIYTNYRWGRI